MALLIFLLNHILSFPHVFHTILDFIITHKIITGLAHQTLKNMLATQKGGDWSLPSHSIIMKALYTFHFLDIRDNHDIPAAEIHWSK